MKSLSAGVRVAILFLLLAIGTYVVWKNLGQNPAGKNNQVLFARFKDASGLPKKSKVVVAGLPQGEARARMAQGAIRNRRCLSPGFRRVPPGQRNRQIGSQLKISAERSSLWNDDFSAGIAWSAMVCGVQPSLRCTERSGRF